MNIHPIILCGGSGTRLWPISRAKRPKQLVRAFDELSLFQLTLERLRHELFAQPIVITSYGFRFEVAAQIEEMELEAEIILEPQARDTLAAIAAGALVVKAREREGIALVTPCDHKVVDKDVFTETAIAAAQVAKGDRIVTFGVFPDYPATGYGYIQPEGSVSDSCLPVKAFVEKPDADKAEKLIRQGHLWNAGIFCFKAALMLDEIACFEAESYQLVCQSYENRERHLDFQTLGSAFSATKKISLDYAVMERTTKAMVIPARFDWSDVGDWRELYRIGEKDKLGNVKEGDIVLDDVSNSFIRAESRLVCALGVKDLIVVETSDALLIAHREKSQQVKELVKTMVQQGRQEVITHPRCYRPWGWYQSIDRGARFHVKRINVKPEARLSLQKNFHRAEHWIVVKGVAQVQVGDEHKLLAENQSIYIPIAVAHRLANPGRIPLEIIEVQSGAYLNDDGIVRLEDEFKRTQLAES